MLSSILPLIRFNRYPLTPKLNFTTANAHYGPDEHLTHHTGCIS